MEKKEKKPIVVKGNKIAPSNKEKKEIMEKKQTIESLLEDRMRKEEAKKKREADLIESKKIKVVLNHMQFTQICKTGFMTTQEKNGRTDLTFSSSDMLTLCKGGLIEKEGLDQTYKFGIINIGSYDIKEILKRSPIFSGLSEQIQ